MFTAIAESFVTELRHHRSIRTIVSDSSEEEEEEEPQKRKRGRPKLIDKKEETILLIEKIDLVVQEVKIEGLCYNKCIYTSDLYDKSSGLLVGRYDSRSHRIIR